MDPLWCGVVVGRRGASSSVILVTQMMFKVSKSVAKTPRVDRYSDVNTVSQYTSDEAHFWLNGYVNKQNSRIWSEANPQVYVKTPLHPEKLTVWCALWAGGTIGPYFFKNDEGHNVKVNGDLSLGIEP
ncbi:transposable element Tc3 transposase [Trichonephila clavipes]|nr:transposable element Tc3 transposase [Trichonephila clavipes]